MAIIPLLLLAILLLFAMIMVVKIIIEAVPVITFNYVFITHRHLISIMTDVMQISSMDIIKTKMDLIIVLKMGVVI